MKTTIPRLAATSLFAAFITTSAHAGVKLVNHGRAGFVAVPKETVQSAKQDIRRETTVALVIEKPRESASKLQTMGRAGYRYVSKQQQGY